MACVNSSLVLWTEQEIFPRGMFLTCSGSGGDRILFWQAAPSLSNKGCKREKCKVETPTHWITDGISSKLQDQDKDFGTSSTISSAPRSDGQGESNPKTDHNPFALNLILDGCLHNPDTSLISGPVSGATCPGFTCSSSDRAGGLTSTISSNLSVNQSLGNNTTTLFNTTPAMNIGNMNTSINDPCFSNRLNEATAGVAVTVSSSGISSIGGIPTNLLLSLLHHQRAQTLQSKIYTKLDRNVFIGSTFNLTPCGSEMAATQDMYSARPIVNQSDLESSNLDSEIAQSYHSTLSFAIVFLMDMASPPSVLSHYTELARLIGSQIRRAELVSGYLNKQREIIASILEQTYANCTSWDNINSLPAKIWTDNLRYSTANQHGCKLKRNSRPSPICANKDLSTGPNDSDFGLAKHLHLDKDDLPEKNNCPLSSGQNTLERLTEHSTLCAELKLMIESICTTGHVNTQINGLYPVFFCLPHKAYGLIDQAVNPTPAIRPSAVWRAMEKIRPYHSLMLCLRKQHLFRYYLPADTNPALSQFILNLSPTTSLLNIAQRMNTQNHCLNLALWLIYRGFAFIVYPIVANNTYVLSPHSIAWFTPQLIAHFAATFPQVNFAELLASFSMGFSLKDCSSADEHVAETKFKMYEKVNVQVSQQKTDSSNSNSTLSGLSFEKKVELVTWLLRRRLIMQIHLYVFANFSQYQNPVEPSVSHRSLEQDENQTSSSDSELTYSKEILPQVCVCRKISSCTLNGINQSPVIHNANADRSTSIISPDETNRDIPRTSDESGCSIPMDIFAQLNNNLPQKNKQVILAEILDSFGRVGDVSLLHLFARILPRLPAHFEELMFAENVDRHTLTECIERFSKFLLTARIPDPVTACFAGIPWCD